MINMFSMFDPTSMNFSSNWLIIPLIMIMLPMMFWNISSQMNFFMMKFYFKKSSIYLMFITIFISISYINLLSLTPFIFVSFSQYSFSLSIALPIWLMIILNLFFKKTKLFLANNMSKNTPTSIIMLMILTETVSTLIQPITLTIRLSINLMTGHIILLLISMLMFNIQFLMFPIMLMFCFLEMMISLIQASIMSSLLMMYSN